MDPEGPLSQNFRDLLKSLAALPDEATAGRGCVCGAEVYVFTGRRSGYIWVKHGLGKRACPREGFECRLEPGTPEPFVEYETLAPEIGGIVSNEVPATNEFDF